MEPRAWQRHYDYDVPTTIRYPRIPAQDFLYMAAGGFPDKPALNFYGTEITFWELRSQVLRMAEAMGVLGVRKGDRVGIHLPTSPQYVIAYYAALSLGAVVVNLNPMYTFDELRALAEDTGITTLFTFDMVLPTIINAVINHPRAGDLDLARRIGLLNSGAAPMPVELIEQVKDAGISYSEGWGMSETTSLGISNPVLGLRKTGSIGIPWPDTDVRFVDVEEGNHEVARGEPGEIVIRSPLVMQGYWDNPEETAGQLKDGWLHTGDIAVRDEEDYIFIVDRKKDMIIAGGYNIYPREIDEVLYQHPKIRDACTVGIPDAYRGETVKAFIVPGEGETLTEEEVMSFCKEKLAAYKRPKTVEFRKDLPKSAVGKILRRRLREEEEARQGREQGPTDSFLGRDQ